MRVDHPDTQRGGVPALAEREGTGRRHMNPPRRRLDQPARRLVLDLAGADERFRGTRGEVATHQRDVAEREKTEQPGPRDRPRSALQAILVDPVRRRLNVPEEGLKLLRRLLNTVDALPQRLFEQPVTAL